MVDEQDLPLAGPFDVEQVGRTVVLMPMKDLGELHAEEFIKGLKAVRKALSNTDYRNVVFDFKRTDYFGSTVLNEFIYLWKELQSREGRLALCGLSPHEQEILRVTRLNHRWLICDSRDDAVQQLEPPSD